MTRPKCVGNKRTHESQRPPSDTFQNSKLRDDSSHNDAASSYLSPNKHDKLEGKNNIDKQRFFFFFCFNILPILGTGLLGFSTL